MFGDLEIPLFLSLCPLQRAALTQSSVHHPPWLVPRQACLDWATLLWRVFAVDATVCPSGSGTLNSTRERSELLSSRELEGREARRAGKVLCAINDRRVAEKILGHLGLPVEGPRCAPARGPPEPEFDFDIDQDTEPWGDDEGLELEDENLEA